MTSIEETRAEAPTLRRRDIRQFRRWTAALQRHGRRRPGYRPGGPAGVPGDVRHAERS